MLLFGVIPHNTGFPYSRDYGLTEFICKQVSCISNKNGLCVSPARCIIGEDGKCEGYKYNK